MWAVLAQSKEEPGSRPPAKGLRIRIHYNRSGSFLAQAQKAEALAPPRSRHQVAGSLRDAAEGGSRLCADALGSAKGAPPLCGFPHQDRRRPDAKTAGLGQRRRRGAGFPALRWAQEAGAAVSNIPLPPRARGAPSSPSAAASAPAEPPLRGEPATRTLADAAAACTPALPRLHHRSPGGGHRALCGDRLSRIHAAPYSGEHGSMGSPARPHLILATASEKARQPLTLTAYPSHLPAPCPRGHARESQSWEIPSVSWR